ncbi:hypothetical protein RHGRI_016134 [Rhododendron griersonianum]|uniref:Cystatin domain-containing protein n=1 Tax=Rhododendron griersonianum TaxID=479676 RepID=A0AAV6JT28_9ERIC|nr:hypothetical protein RHGRI_016134 [Rhododendron griersonianum]KAG5543300.1 hypothetical protein RHGRI_016134 [Rhododendron griersonianum]
MATPISVTTPSPTQSSTAISERRRRDDDPIIHPERPGKPVCSIYKHHGRCNFELHVYSIIPKIYNQWLCLLIGMTPTGFHVGYVPLGSRLGGMICPVPLSQCGSGKNNLAKLAIKGYNEEYGTTYKFVKLIRVNSSAVGGVLNFITFQAKDGKPGSRPQNFQTRVYQCIEKTEVQFCRLEQKKSTLPEGTLILGKHRSSRTSSSFSMVWFSLEVHVMRICRLQKQKAGSRDGEGFHVGYVPLGSRRGGIIYPVPLSQCSSIPKNLAKLAIKGYNEEHATTYKFVKLIRVNMKSVGGIVYYITFQAKDMKPGSRPQNFQTRVFESMRETEVHLCRLEQKKSMLPKGPGETSQQQDQ